MPFQIACVDLGLPTQCETTQVREQGMGAASPGVRIAQQITGLLPDTVAEKLMENAGVARLHALHLAIDIVRCGDNLFDPLAGRDHDRRAARRP
jgi:hypothetical protein